jgi:hypothetical protein
MESLLKHNNLYSTESPFSWSGLSSSKFGRTRLNIPPKNDIKSSKIIINLVLDIPNQTSFFSRRHYSY